MKLNLVMKGLHRFWEEEEGMGTLEILLIVAVLIIIAIALPICSKI